MNVLKLSAQLQKEAQELFNDKALWLPFTNHGKVYMAGSAYLDLLVFPDLDVYFETAKESEDLTVFSKAIEALILQERVTNVELEKDLHIRLPDQVPEGLFFQYRIHHGKHHWKVDVWALKDKHLLTEKMEESAQFKSQMTAEERRLILEVKYRLMEPFGRTPVGSSYLVYLAVLKENLRSVDEVIAYLRDQGGNVDRLK